MPRPHPRAFATMSWPWLARCGAAPIKVAESCLLDADGADGNGPGVTRTGQQSCVEPTGGYSCSSRVRGAASRRGMSTPKLKIASLYGARIGPRRRSASTTALAAATLV